jgi:hypothetical protein
MQGCHDRHTQGFQEHEQMAAGFAAEDPELML